MALSFVNVTSEDQMQQLASLAAEIWREYYVSIITSDQIEYMIHRFQSKAAVKEQINNQGYEYYCILKGDTIVGYMSVKQDEGKLFLSKFYIRKEYRGQGYASHALAFVEQLCKDRGLTHIWLTVNRHNESSIAVYRKKGFHTIREQVADIGNGYVMDDYVMEKECDDGA